MSQTSPGITPRFVLARLRLWSILVLATESGSAINLYRAQLLCHPGIPAGIGPFSLRFENGELIVHDERGGLSLSAHQVSVTVDGHTILQPTSLSVAPGEFVALIGLSGSGKTTLLKCLAGVGEPGQGQVSMGSDPLELRLTEVGYVPQSDVVHERLSVREALLYAARLRLPSDTRGEEHVAAVDDVLEELRLGDHQDTPIGRLSGGQRKRVACGVELIGKPTMLLLDEPTSGLDPPLEHRLMLDLPPPGRLRPRHRCRYPRDQQPRALRHRRRDGRGWQPAIHRLTAGEPRALRRGCL